MSNPTSNFGWQMPTPVDLVTDLPADFEVFGQAVDSSLADLKGGTTGQILAKNSNTDMDFTWVTSAGDIEGVAAGTGISGGGTSGTVTITNSMATAITTNGDLIYGTGLGTFTRRGIGSTGQVLTVSGGVPTWSSPAGGGKVLQVVMGTFATSTTSTSTSLVNTGLNVNITPSATSSKVLVMVTIPFNLYRGASNGAGSFVIFRDTTEIQNQSGGTSIYLAATPSEVELQGTWSMTFLDSPATTSAINYKVQFRAASGSRIGLCDSSKTATITVMEIGA